MLKTVQATALASLADKIISFMEQPTIETFSLDPQVIRFAIRQSDGTEAPHELREMLAGDRDKYMDRVGARSKVNDKGEVVGITKYEGMHADLLTLSVVKVNGNSAQPVTREEVQTWPASMTNKLFDLARNLSGLSGRPGDTEKKG